ncbi:MAG: chemotaxis protein CheW [Gammaproteobacteria bacterium]|nr:chemotaxis protein CheW [Gammaproteobacteria bacterium]MBQ0839150.1 chemotaxis protein CheW [Gammaproteobacteria bacterium]
MVENKMVLKAAAAEADASLLQVNSLLLPVADTALLVPQVAVAEVLSWGELGADDLRPEKAATSPHCYGWVRWRDHDIPLLSFDSVYNGHRPPLDNNLKIVICNAVFTASATGFYALLVTNFPRALRLSLEAEMALEGGPSDKPGVQMEVSLDGEEVLIPDFEYLEQIVCEIVEQNAS